MPENVGEMKTKPTQHAVRALNAAGIQPDIILARAKAPVDKPRKRKISDFCNVDEQDVISAPDVESIYEIPLNFEKDNLGDRILKKFGLKPRRKDLREWQKLLRKIRAHKKLVRVGIVGKYFSIGDFTLMDSYISVIESIKHAAWANNREPQITWLSAEKYTEGGKTLAELKEFDGIIVPGGFGTRGIEGKIKAIQFCREKKIPYLGLCLGLQLALIEFARNVCGLKDATSREFVKDAKTPVIDVMPDQKVLLEEKRYGGTMRLGSYPCRIKKGTLAYAAYGSGNISERHRHRYELNNEYREALQSKGMVFSGVNPDRDLVEIAELKEHPFFLGTQFHPEFKSRPLRPHPLFRAFIKASCKT
ncbi:MAG: CTP synthetase [Parcubacteria group bacterium GW2011_GWA2_50_10]|nr:MAG: CTP synthetase [Parcubacteria group bacterium GW2011_GWA2_50_10]